MLYWIVINGQKTGPLTLEEVMRHPIQPDTLVWHQGLPTWVPASRVSELRQVFTPVCLSITPEPETVQPAQTAVQPTPTKPPTYLVWSIVTLLLFSAIPAIIALVYAIQVTPAYDRNDFDSAQKASSKAEIWVLVSIALGTMFFPFQLLMMLS